MRENLREGRADAVTPALDVGSNANMVARTEDNLFYPNESVKRGGHHGKE